VKNFVVIIPARFASERLPGKPLKNIAENNCCRMFTNAVLRVVLQKLS